MKAIVVFDTRYGNTEKVAKSLQTGLSQGGIDAVCVDAKDVVAGTLSQHELICVGAPTEGFTASVPIKEFFRKMESEALAGKRGFAFDTKANPGIFGSAAKFIEKRLKSQGLQIVAPRESAIVFTAGSTKSARLKEGEEERFEKIGLRIASAAGAMAGESAAASRSSVG